VRNKARTGLVRLPYRRVWGVGFYVSSPTHTFNSFSWWCYVTRVCRVDHLHNNGFTRSCFCREIIEEVRDINTFRSLGSNGTGEKWVKSIHGIIRAVGLLQFCQGRSGFSKPWMITSRWNERHGSKILVHPRHIIFKLLSGENGEVSDKKRIFTFPYNHYYEYIIRIFIAWFDERSNYWIFRRYRIFNIWCSTQI